MKVNQKTIINMGNTNYFYFGITIWDDDYDRHFSQEDAVKKSLGCRCN